MHYITHMLLIFYSIPRMKYSSDDPKENLLGTPWWTDGQRAVLMLSDTPVPTEEIQFLDWTGRISEPE